MLVSESPLRDLLRVIVWHPFRWAAQLLPPPMAVSVFRFMGEMHYAFARARREHIIENLRRIRPDVPVPESARMARDCFRNHYISQLLVMVYPGLGLEGLERLAVFEGLEHLSRALEKGKGAVLIHPHFGPEQLALVGLALKGFPVLQIGFLSDEGVSRVGRSTAFRIRQRLEARMPGEILDARGEYRPAYRHLEGNGAVMITGDGSGREMRLGKHAPLTFFGHRVLFPTGAPRMAKKAGSDLLPLFVLRGEATPYRIVVEPPIPAGDPVGMTEAFVRRYESHAAEDPGLMRFLDVFEPGKLIEPDP